MLTAVSSKYKPRVVVIFSFLLFHIGFFGHLLGTTEKLLRLKSEFDNTTIEDINAYLLANQECPAFTTPTGLVDSFSGAGQYTLTPFLCEPLIISLKGRREKKVND